jgi:hypothetical protein
VILDINYCILCGSGLVGEGILDISRFSFLEDGVFLNVGLVIHICALCKTKKDMQKELLNLPELPSDTVVVASTN